MKKKQKTAQDIKQILWQAADKLRANMDAAEYKHVVLGLIFLKYVSDCFDEFRRTLVEEFKNSSSEWYLSKATQAQMDEELEDRDYYKRRRVFWVPEQARWQGDKKKPGLQAQAMSSDIGKIIDAAMLAIEKENPPLKNVLPRIFAQKQSHVPLGELVNLVSRIGFNQKEHRASDFLGEVYEYFLGQFASAEGKRGGQFYTPRSVVNLIVECLEPYRGRVYDPCVGSGGFFVSSDRFIAEHTDQNHIDRAKDRVSLYGQESNATTWKLSAMNMAIRGIRCDLGRAPADTFHNDQHPQLKADFVMANPPFNVSDWGGDKLKDDRRWLYGVPPVGNANFAWLQHMIYHLAPRGCAGVVLANGSMSSQVGGEGDIRKQLVEADLVDAMIALPGQLFFNTQIPACIWILSKGRGGGGGDQSSRGLQRKRVGEVLFIDARAMGHMISRSQRAFAVEDIARIADAYHRWRSEGVAVAASTSVASKVKSAKVSAVVASGSGSGENVAAVSAAGSASGENVVVAYRDVPGFCKSVTVAEIKKHEFVLTPGRYVGSAEVVSDEAPFHDRMQDLTQQLGDSFKQSHALEKKIKSNMALLGFKIE